ncbi:hypothetical protein [Streptomyces buecherae]|uniref:hypothetical protein n=1 Tax=Streptomyces buecherae TaxID=2763006 RepID=UPI001C2807F4|nr:hypothetical protein [Streptomyces buecherae]
MPRGRHRHSLPLHRLLPPLAVAGVSTACAAAAWLVGEPLLVRSLATVAAVAAIVGAVLLRRWDSAADKRLADLNRARLRDEWRTEERVAELEADAERARVARTKLDAKLRAKRAELARLRNEHAALLRRYATAETERARTLEERRRLALGTPSATAAAPDGDAVETPGASVAAAAVAAARGARADAARPATGRERAAATGGVPTMRLTGLLQPAVYERAATALRDLARNAAEQRATVAVKDDAVTDGVATADVVTAGVTTADVAAGATMAGVTVAGAEPVEQAVPAEPAGSVAAGSGVAPGLATAARTTADAAADRDAVRDTRAAEATEAAEHGRADGVAGLAGPATAPIAAAVVPQPAQPAPQWRPASRAVGGFDFFGNASGAPAARRADALEDDLADVVGAEAIADHAAHARDAHQAQHAQGTQEAQDATTASAEDAADDRVIDLTAHDETEQIDLAELRGAIS